MIILVCIIVLALLLGSAAVRNLIAFIIGAALIITILGGAILALASGQ